MSIRLLREVQRLESLVSLRRGSAPTHPVVRAALKRTSTDDLLLLIGALEGQGLGKEPSREQVSGGERLQSAMEAECLQAGFKSLAEFDRLCPATMSKTSFRGTGRAHWR